MRERLSKLGAALVRVLAVLAVLGAVLGIAYAVWTPGLDVRDGRHDRGHNGIWLAHGWLGADEWFVRYRKTHQLARYRDPTSIAALAAKLRTHHVTDLFPHLCPAGDDGRIPAVDDAQVERFLDAFAGSRVLPWIGGPNGAPVALDDAGWRAGFVRSAAELLTAHPRLAGVQVNVEPLRTGTGSYLVLLEELRKAMPEGKLLSVAAYPPPTRWHPYPDVHWEEAFFREVASRSDQLAVMAYDTALRAPKLYEGLMADWTRESLAWSEGRPVLLGVPTYDDAGTGYHHPSVENLTHALRGIHRGLAGLPVLPAGYQGIAVYCDWETDEAEWAQLREQFLMPEGSNR